MPRRPRPELRNEPVGDVAPRAAHTGHARVRAWTIREWAVRAICAAGGFGYAAATFAAADELAYHAGGLWRGWACIGAALAFGAAGSAWLRDLRFRRRTAAATGGGHANGTVDGGAALLAAAGAWLVLCGVSQGLESYRAWLVQQFLVPPQVMRGLILAPALLAGCLAGAVTACYCFKQRHTDVGHTTTGQGTGPAALISIGGIAGGLGSAAALGGSAAWVAALVAAFGAAALAAAFRVSDSVSTGEAGVYSRPVRWERRLRLGICIASVLVILIAGGILGPRSRTQSAPSTMAAGESPLAAVAHQALAGKRPLRIEMPDLARGTAAAGGAWDLDLQAARHPALILAFTAANPASAGSGGSQAVAARRAARRLIHRLTNTLAAGGYMIVEPGGSRAAIAALDCLRRDLGERGWRGYALHVSTADEAYTALLLGPDVPAWIAGQAWPAGVNVELREACRRRDLEW